MFDTMALMTMTADLKEQTLRVAGLVDPDLMTGSQAARAVEDLAVAEKALAGTLLFMALRVAKTNAWQGKGYATAADWLASMVGISVHEANRQLGTARKAENLEKTKRAMKDGSISPDQADAVTDAATADPTAEDELLDTAKRDTTKNLKEKAAARKAAVTDDAARERRIRRERSVRRYVDRDGAYNLHLRGPAADGARIEALLRPHEEQAFRIGRADGVRDSFENRSYDAFLAALGLAPGRQGSAVEAAPLVAPVKVPAGINVKVIVNVDHAALLRGHTVAGETCHVAGVGPVSVEAVRDILRDDPFLAVVVKKGQDVVSVAHHGRGLNAAQRTAIEADRGIQCSNIRCNRTVAIQIDHRHPYAADPVTTLDNSDPLCSGGCHNLKTHHGHELEAGTGRRRLLPPGHPEHPSKLTPDRASTESAPAEPDFSPPARVEQPTLC